MRQNGRNFNKRPSTAAIKPSNSVFLIRLHRVALLEQTAAVFGKGIGVKTLFIARSVCSNT